MKPKNELENNASGITKQDPVAAAAASLRIPVLAGLGLLAGITPAHAQQPVIPPVAESDSYIVGLNGELEVNASNSFQKPFTDNDTFDPANCANVTVELLSIPSHGELTLAPFTSSAVVGDVITCSSNVFGNFTYVPDVGHAGTDTFTYALVDGMTGQSSNTTVFLTTSPLPGIGSLGAGLLAPMAALALMRRRKQKT